jgi:uncharacterized protein (DUF427 family)
MTMTVGQGPFGHRPSGEFNFDAPKQGMQYLDAFPRRIRAYVGDELVVDTTAAKLLYEQHSLPVWVFPVDEVRRDLLPDDAASVYEDGLAEGMVHVQWDAADRWLEEDEEVIVHPRDPYHRIELRSTSRRVTVTLDGETLADSTNALALFEAALPPRWYLPEEDVAAELSDNPDVRTGCAYKGWASYHDVRVGARREPFLAWHYDQPLDGVERIKDRICFFNERVDISVGGVEQERPQTQWSGTDWANSEWAKA